MRIPEQKIEEIRSAADIVDVVSGYVQLRKRGRNFIGLCPFHQEKTPSFTVSGDKQIYHCFGCGAGGNVFKFLMEFKNISFIESVEEIADHLGIKLTFESQGNDQQNEMEDFYEINLVAARYFSNNLLKSNDGEIAREYLKKRNIKPATQKIFGVGWAPYGWDNFLEHAKENKLDLKRVQTLGLIDTKDGGNYYDKYRGRVIFPIFSPNGRVIAFGGRILEKQENAAKYLNSPESPIYFKRKSLYGLFHSKEEIRKLDKAILVEGYMDLISLFQAGVKNVVASSGTSLTDEQVQLLSRFTKNIIILFDADPAGQKASLRSIEILLKQDFEVKVLELPKGEDPDSYIQNYGKEKFDEIVLKARNFLEYQTAQYEAQGLFEDPNELAKAIRNLVHTLALVSDELKRNLLLKSISKKFNLREKLIESELNAFLSQNREKQDYTETRRDAAPKATQNLSAISRTAAVSRENPFEKELIRMLFSGDEDIVEYILHKIPPSEFGNNTYRKLADLVSDAFNERKTSPAYLIEKIQDEDVKSFLLKLTLSEEAISKKWDDFSFNGKISKDTQEHAISIVNSFLIHNIDMQIRLNNSAISETKDEVAQLELLRHNKELSEERRELIAGRNGNTNNE